MFFPAAVSVTGKNAQYKTENGVLKTSGGRVLGVTETAKDLKSALEKAYEDVQKIAFKNAYYRKDIGARALKAEE